MPRSYKGETFGVIKTFNEWQLQWKVVIFFFEDLRIVEIKEEEGGVEIEEFLQSQSEIKCQVRANNEDNCLWSVVW